MNTSRFDAVARAIASRTDRRRAVHALLGGAIGLAGATEATLAKSGGCDTPCGPCATCEPGACKKKRGKKRCKPGRCAPAANGATCGGSGQCLDGVCNPEPTCAPYLSSCIPDGDCCSGVCTYFDMALNNCERGASGTQCHDEDDCESASCRSFRCA